MIFVYNSDTELKFLSKGSSELKIHTRATGGWQAKIPGAPSLQEEQSISNCCIQKTIPLHGLHTTPVILSLISKGYEKTSSFVHIKFSLTLELNSEIKLIVSSRNDNGCTKNQLKSWRRSTFNTFKKVRPNRTYLY